MAKPKVLIVSDSAFLDTGFGRVAREIGTALCLAGYSVTQLGWFHRPTDKLVPFRVIPTDRSSPEMSMLDQYGQLTYPQVINKVKPGLVIALGDEWMLKHLVKHPRTAPLVGYVPIDSVPVSRKWAMTFGAFDRLVVFGGFGNRGVRAADPSLEPDVIPHGVDTKTFRPLDSKDELRSRIAPKAKFLVGCVARNNVRKNIPRLIKTFRQFINPSTTCNACGSLVFQQVNQCGSCGGSDLVQTAAKTDSSLYLHMTAEDPAGHDLHELISRFGLGEYVCMPVGMKVGEGVSDTRLNEVMNGFDVFALPTTGEGFGLPIAEAMSCGLPVVVTDYSGHKEYVEGAGELIRVLEFETAKEGNGERAIVDLFDFVAKLDRLYYEPATFIRKWGPYLIKQMGMLPEQVQAIISGQRLRAHMGNAARARMGHYDWSDITVKWVDLVNGMFGNRSVPSEDENDNVRAEVL